MNVDELARAERLVYFRQWRASNKDRVKQYNENYWRRRAKKRLKEAEHAKDANKQGSN